MDDAPERLQRLPSWLLNQAAIPANRLVAEAFGAAGLRRHHYAMLTVLAEGGPSSQAELGRRTMIDRSDVVAAVDELAEQRLVVRAADPADRRRNVISLTAAGTRRLRELDALVDGAQAQLLAPLAARERKQLVALLRRVVAHHRA